MGGSERYSAVSEMMILGRKQCVIMHCFAAFDVPIQMSANPARSDCIAISKEAFGSISVAAQTMSYQLAAVDYCHPPSCGVCEVWGLEAGV